MSLLMVQAKIKEDRVAEVEAAAKKMFEAIAAAQPKGVRYASTKQADGVSFVILLQLDGPENPLTALPEFTEFQDNLKQWIDGPPAAGPLEIVGSYRLFE